MNKKGFTLVELLVVIILLSVVLIVSFTGVDYISKIIKKQSLDKKIELIEQGAIYWGQNNKAILNANDNCYVGESATVSSAEISSGEIREIPKLYSCYKISIKDLYEEDYIESDANNGKIINPLNDVDLTKISNCNVHVYKKNNRVYAYFGDKSCQLGF